jgi:hypothetical protein
MRSVLMKVFDICKLHMNVFTPVQRENILSWSEEVTRPRRERKSISRFSGHNDDISRGIILPFTYNQRPSSTEDRNRLEKRRRGYFEFENEDLLGMRPWSDKERRKFHSAFVSFGPCNEFTISTR